MDGNATGSTPKLPAQCRTLVTDESGRAQRPAATRESPTRDHQARNRCGASRLGPSPEPAGTRSIRIALHPGTPKSGTNVAAANRNGAAKRNSGAHSATKKRVPDRSAKNGSSDKTRRVA